GLALKGMGALSGPELGGERLTVAYETRAQENEHSCFSDNTVSDLADDALGIDNVCAGRYERTEGEAVHGTGLCDAVAAHEPALGERLRENVGASLAKLRAIPAPFDRAIQGDDGAPGRVAVQAAITALETQANTLAAIAASYHVRPGDVPRRRQP
ncbi:MAG TPA: imelysin family protein, partial [Polyangiaceae bacterium]|nr:imelysin family protein [Polyangiaceae bacterium]